MLSIAILTYKDDVIFTSLLILYFLAVYHPMAYHLRNYYIYGTSLATYTFIKAFGKFKLKRTKQTE